MTLQKGRPIEERLRKFLERELGPFEAVRFCGWDHAESNVWEVIADDTRYYLKKHKQPRKFRQEVYAYQHWAPSLNNVPKLIASCERPHALLISAVPGVLVQETALTKRQERKVYRRAGALLRRLHDLPFEDTDALPLADALRKRSTAWTRRAQGTVEEALIGWVRRRLEAAAVQIAQSRWTRTPCHRDYIPRNWLLDEETLHLIDFEHSKPDLWLTDLEKLYWDVWLQRPELKVAFLEGYGRTLSEEEERVLRGLAVHNVFVSIVWATEHRDETFERRGREVLAQLRQMQ